MGLCEWSVSSALVTVADLRLEKALFQESQGTNEGARSFSAL